MAVSVAEYLEAYSLTQKNFFYHLQPLIGGTQDFLNTVHKPTNTGAN